MKDGVKELQHKISKFHWTTSKMRHLVSYQQQSTAEIQEQYRDDLAATLKSVVAYSSLSGLCIWFLGNISSSSFYFQPCEAY